jgi:ADP-heptose:LPS heptosyltransferase
MSLHKQESYVLAIRFRQLGDVLATLDALKALKEAEPDRPIAFVVDDHYHDMLRGEKYIDLLLGAPPRVKGFVGFFAFLKYVRRLRGLGAGVTLDFHSNARSAFLTLLSGAGKRVGFDVKGRKAAYTSVVPRAEFRDGRVVRRHSAASALEVARRAGTGERKRASLPEITISAAALERGREILEGAGLAGGPDNKGLLVGLNPGKPYPAKAWPEKYFVDLAQELSARGHRVVILWGPGEREAAEKMRAQAGSGTGLSPEVTLAEMPGFIKQFDLIVSIDSGLKHVAVCARVPTVTIFGSTSPKEWHMGTARDRILWKGYSCSPCRRPDCPFGAPCMSSIRPGDVLDEIDRSGLLDRHKGGSSGL